MRTSAKAHNRLIELVKAGVNGHADLNMIGVIGANAGEAASAVLHKVMKQFEPDEILLANLSPVLGTHTGPGTIGLAYVAGVDPELLGEN